MATINLHLRCFPQLIKLGRRLRRDKHSHEADQAAPRFSHEVLAAEPATTRLNPQTCKSLRRGQSSETPERVEPETGSAESHWANCERLDSSARRVF